MTVTQIVTFLFVGAQAEAEPFLRDVTQLSDVFGYGFGCALRRAPDAKGDK